MASLAESPSVSASPDFVTVRSFHSLETLQELQPLWDELLDSYPVASIFSTWEWLTCWWRSFSRGRELRVLALFDAESHLAGIAPLSITRESYVGFVSLNVVRFMADGSGDSDNLDFPVRPGYESLLAKAVLTYLEDHRREWNILELNTTPAGSPVVDSITGALLPSRWTIAESYRKRSPVKLPATWSEYLGRLSSEDRNNLARYERRLEKRYSVRIYKCAEERELPKVLAALFRLHQCRWQQSGEPGTFASSKRREFYRDVSRALLAKNRLELWVMELDGEIAAAQFGLRYRDHVYQLQEGFDPGRSSDRVGFILRGAVLRQLIAEGAQVYDFLGGEDSYKARWAASEECYRDVHLARARDLGGLVLRSLHRGQSTKRWMRRTLPDSTWAALHAINVFFKAGGKARPDNSSKMQD